MLPINSFEDMEKLLIDWMCGTNTTRPILRGTPLANTGELLGMHQTLFQNTCLVDIMTAIPHALAIIILPTMLMATCCCVSLKAVNKTRYLLKFPGHGRRWIATFILLIVLACSTTEGIIMDVAFQHGSTIAKPTKPHLYLPDACAIVATIMAILYNHLMEVRQRPRMAWLLLLYWVATAVADSLYLIHLVYLQLAEPSMIVFDIAVVTAALHIFFLLNEVNVIRLKIIFSESPRTDPTILKKDEDLSDVAALPSDLKLPNMYFLDEYCSTLSRITFSWLGQLLKIGFKRPLDLEDLGSLPEIHEARFNHERFTKVLEKEKKRAAESGVKLQLWRVCMRAYWWDIVTTGGLRLVAEMARLVSPLSISGIILFITENETQKRQQEEPHFLTVQEFFSNGFVLIGVMFIGTVVRSLCMATYWQWTVLLSQHVYCALQTVVYEKSLHLRTFCNGKGSLNVGRITNHISTDADSIFDFFMSLHQAWIMPMLGVLTLILLFMELGASALLCIIVMAMTLIIQLKIACLTTQMQKRVMLFADERLKKCSEMFQGIQLLKLYSWEKLYCKSIKKVRTKELWEILKINILLAISGMLTYIFPFFITLTAFGSYTILSGQPLTPDVTFSSFVLINIIMVVIYKFPCTLASYVNALISSRRLQDFLSTPEVEKRFDDGPEEFSAGKGLLSPVSEETTEEVTIKRSKRFLTRKRRENDMSKLLPATPPPLLRDSSPSHSPSSTSPSDDSDTKRNNIDGLPSNIAVKIENGSFTWDIDSNVPVLSNINVEIPAGKLTVVVGPVGGGKSSFGQAILGEMKTLTGSIKFRKKRNTIAFAAQRPWLINGSLRDNILFGQPYHAKRYQKVIKACALQADIDILPAGDLTEIGEKGLNLSGGQKQRVSIARAIYSERSIAVLDDVLSALDMRISSQVFEDGIIRMMRRSRQTVILVTHQLQCLQKADHIIVMKDGKICRQGSRQDIAQQDPSLYCRWKRAVHLVSESETESEVESETLREERQNLLKQVSKHRTEGEDRCRPGAKDGALVQSEDRELGPVSCRVYLYYIRAMGLRALGLIIATYLMRESLRMSANFWLSSWSTAGLLQAQETGQEGASESVTIPYLIGYTVIVIGCILATSIANASLVYSVIMAAKHLHAGMLGNIIGAPMRFFDTTPVGRILNRFSCDISIIDRSIIVTADSLLFYLLSCISALIINIVVMPIFVLAFLPVCLCYILLQKYFIASGRELKRLQNVTRSPVIAHFVETLDGLSTIRAYRAERRFLDITLQRVTVNAKAFIYLWCTYRWIGVRMDMLGSLLVLFTSISTMYGAIYRDLDPSLAALAITFILRVSSQINWLVRYANDMEIQMNSVERVQHYSSLANELYSGTAPPPDWPDKGHVAFDNVSLRYATDLQVVVDGVNVEFNPGEKVALCGQTGSGKTSLALSLFRILDICQGHIFIDGLDITTVPIEALRRALSIIPQNPELFMGTIRRNLDPEGKNSDIELWDSLEIAQLKQVVTHLQKGLDSEVAEGGENFSVGQRQLFCLARAFLRKSRILVMDEATASMDIDTDKILQEVVATTFADRTILTIAHRISTIMNFDTVLVLSNGKIIEHDSPTSLINREDSVFASLARGNE